MTPATVAYTAHARGADVDSVAWRRRSYVGVEPHTDSGCFRIAVRDAARIARLIVSPRFLREYPPSPDCPDCEVFCIHCRTMHAQVRGPDHVRWFIPPVPAPEFPALDLAIRPLRDSLARIGSGTATPRAR